NVIERVAGRDASIYEALLLLSLDGTKFRKDKDWNDADKILDRLGRDALIAYLGLGAQGRRFASPASDGRPTGFSPAVRWIAGLLNLEVGVGPKNPHKKDGGVDVVAWRPFRDGRSKFAVVLAQCTIKVRF